MSRTHLKRRAAASVQPPASLPRPPTREEFQAECEALTNALVVTLSADVQTKTEPPALDGVAVSAQAETEPEPDDQKAAWHPTEISFVPPYNFITSAKSDSGLDDVTIPRQLLEFLLQCLLSHVDFDELQYQLCNPDVAAAVEQRQVTSGREHFIKTGYFEGRSGGVPVDEDWYLTENPDVGAAKEAGKFASGTAQYRLSGASEWRVPNQQSETAIAMWKNIIAK